MLSGFTAPAGVPLPTVSIAAADKSVLFSPTGLGDFSFAYAIKDGQGLTDIATMNVHVDPDVSLVPVA